MSADRIERDERGKPWLRCTAEHPLCAKFTEVGTEHVRVYHPDAKVIDTDSSVGFDERYECPHCKLSWWMEVDG